MRPSSAEKCHLKVHVACVQELVQGAREDSLANRASQKPKTARHPSAAAPGEPLPQGTHWRVHQHRPDPGLVILGDHPLRISLSPGTSFKDETPWVSIDVVLPVLFGFVYI